VMLLSALMFFAAANEPIEGKVANNPTPQNQFENREEAKIAFESLLNGFRIERENKEDILYLDTGAGNWYRAPLNCFGIGDPQSAMGIIPYDTHGMGIDKFTRFKLTGFSAMDRNDCAISSLIKLTPTETVSLGLESQKRVDARQARVKKQ
jgi:hypothetical protein